MKKSEFKNLEKGNVVKLRTKEELMSVKSCRTNFIGGLYIKCDNGIKRKCPNAFLGSEAVVIDYWSKTEILVMVQDHYHVVVVRQELRKGKIV